MQKEYRVNVYNSEEMGEVIARVRYNQDLDYWNGHNWQNGGTGLHLGISKLKSGGYALIHGTQWQGAKDYALFVSAGDALQAILQSGHLELLDTKKFKELKTLAEQQGLLDSDEPDDE